MGLGEWLYFRDLRKRIRRDGWTTVHVAEGDVDPAFAYTVGFSRGPGEAELIVFGLPPELAQEVLEHAAGKLRNGDLEAQDGAAWDQGSEDVRYVLRQVHPSQLRSDYFGAALWWSSEAKSSHVFAAFQIVGFDRNGRLPWETGCTYGSQFDQKPLYEPLDEQDPDRWFLSIDEKWKAAGQPDLSSAS